jgi:hypothetical protein
LKREEFKLEEEARIIDFGFTLVHEDEIKKEEKANLEKATQQLTEVQIKLNGLKQMIWPLLENLKKDPTKTVIKWPGRVAVITKFMKDIEDFIEKES